MVLGGVQENFLYPFTIRRFQRHFDRGFLVKNFSFRYTEKKEVLC